MEQKRVPRIAIGCYGGRRGLTLAALVRAKLRKDLGEDYHKKVEVYGVGHPEFSKKGKIPNEHREALEQAAKESPQASYALEELGNTERRAISPEEVDEMDELYSFDTYIRDKYRSLSRTGGAHIRTISEVTGVHHGYYGVDYDDTEMPLHYVTDVIVPKKAGKKVSDDAPRSPAKAKWYSLEGRVYEAGTREARVEEARDLIKLADYITDYIKQRHVKK